jgi:predicted MFS family arabinose efflux permease
MFGAGYIGYMTFIIALLKEQGMATTSITIFYSMLGLSSVLAARIWAGMLDKYKGGESMAILCALLCVATVLPLLSSWFVLVFVSGILFGGAFLSVVASTTALVRHNSAPTAWSSGIGMFTTVFALGQIAGPTMVGWISDHFGGLRIGLGCSALILIVGAALATQQKPLQHGH